MKILKRVLFIVLCFSLAMSVACRNKDEGTEFALKEHFYNLYEGESRIVEIYGEKDAEYEFNVTDTTIATVDEAGNISALSEGATVVKVVCGEYSDSFMVKVLKNERYIELSSVETSKVVGSKFDITASVIDKGQDSGKKVAWSISGDCKNEVVDNKITLSPASVGKFTVTATCEDLTATCAVKIVNITAKILDEPNVSVEGHKTLKWDAVTGATEYTIIVNGEEISKTSETSFALTGADNLKDGEKISVAIRSTAPNDYDYIDSNYVHKTVKHEFSRAAITEYSCTKEGSVKFECECGISYTVENYTAPHNFADGKCSDCKKIQSEFVNYVYDPVVNGYYLAGVQSNFSAEELYALSEYDDGKNGLKPVYYVGTNAFFENLTIKKIVLPKSIIGLKTQAFSRMYALEYVDMPGVKLMANPPTYNFGGVDVKFDRGELVFFDTYNLKTVIVGEGYKNAQRDYFIHKWSPNSYVPILDVFVDGTYVDRIFPGGYPMGDITYGKETTKEGVNYMLTGEIYYYDETGEKCGHWWHRDENGNAVKNEEHTIRENKCVNCGFIYNEDLLFKWNQKHETYEVMRVRTGNKDKVITVPAQYDDGIHGLRDVTRVGLGAFARLRNVEKVILPETIKVIDGVAFGYCVNLETVVMPGVTTFEDGNGNTGSGNNFIECRKLKDIVVGPNIKITRQTFYVQDTSYTSRLNIMVTGEENIDSIISYNEDNNNMLTGDIYYYEPNNRGWHGQWWSYDDVGNIIKVLDKHTYSNGVCACGAIEDKNLNYTFDKTSQSYHVIGVKRGSQVNHIEILSEFNDGRNGLKPVTVIAKNAFQNANVEKIYAPESVATVQDRAFMMSTGDRAKLKEVRLPGVTKFEGEFHFAYCRGLTTVVLNSGLKTIPSNSFYNDNNDNNKIALVERITNLYFTEREYELGAVALSNNKLLSGKYFAYNDDEYDIAGCGNWWRYGSNDAIESKMGAHEYAQDSTSCSLCGAIKTEDLIYKYNSDSNSYHVIGVKQNCTEKEIVILSQYHDGSHGLLDVTTIGEGAFKNTNIEKIIAPASVTTVKNAAFMAVTSDRTALKEVHLPGVTTFEGGSHFGYCKGLTKVVLSSELTTIPQNSFYNDNNDNTQIAVVKNVTKLYFMGAVPSLNIAGGNILLSDEKYAYAETFDKCGLLWHYDNGEIVENSNKSHEFVDEKCSKCNHYNTQGIAYEYDETNDCYFVDGIGTCTAKDVTFLSEYDDGEHGEKSVTYIKDAAFAGTSSVPTTATFISITIPASITRIGTKAFSRNNQLIEVKILGNATIEDSFFLCANLKTVIAENVLLDNVKENAFYCCANLETLVVSGNSTSVDISSFDNGGTTVQNSKLHIYLCGTESELTEKGTTDNGNTLYVSTQVYAQGTTPGTWKYVDGVPKVNAE